MTEVLFVTWDGPNLPYLETLFLPIFRGLAGHGFRFHVLQFTWASREERRVQAAAASDAGITYSAFPVLRGPAIPSTVAMIAAGVVAVRRQIRRHGVSLILPRSILPAAMTLGALPHSGLRFAFDADGIAADERVDFGGWRPTGATYRVWREIEAQAVRSADAVLTRTKASNPILLSRGGAGTSPEKFFAIPNSRDPGHFSTGTAGTRAAVRAAWGVAPDAPCLLFVGSIGPQYYPDEMLDFFRRVLRRRADARLVLLTPALDAARAVLERSGIELGRVVLRSVSPSGIASQIPAADLGLALRAPTFSQQGISPVKIAEYLLCGVPALATPIGDLATQLEPGSGLLIDEPRAEELERAARWFVESVLPERDGFRARCREVGLSHFALEQGVRRYAEALRYACSKPGGSPSAAPRA